MSKEIRKLIGTFREKILKESISKKDITKINTIDDFINIVNNLEITPQRGFSYKPNSAINLPTNTLLFHSTTKENIASILQNGFRGVGAYYSSFTKTRKSKEQIVDGNFGFAFDITKKKVDSRYQKDFLYGGWGIVFKSGDACKVYNTGDKQFQVVFDVTKNIDVFGVVNVKIDSNNTKEWVWDIYDENLNLIESDVKLSIFLKSIGKK